jgi:hypothetical protein
MTITGGMLVPTTPGHLNFTETSAYLTVSRRQGGTVSISVCRCQLGVSVPEHRPGSDKSSRPRKRERLPRSS